MSYLYDVHSFDDIYELDITFSMYCILPFAFSWGSAIKVHLISYSSLYSIILSIQKQKLGGKYLYNAESMEPNIPQSFEKYQETSPPSLMNYVPSYS